MLTFLSISGFCYLLYLYNYDRTKFNKIVNYLPKLVKENGENNEINDNKENNDDVEIRILDDYDMTDHPPSKDNPVDYYDNSFSTDFVETYPNFHRFYNFTKKNDEDHTQNV